MKVRDIMTKEIACMSADEPVEKAAELMKQYNVGSIPICEGNKVIGIVTDRDIALRYVADRKNTMWQPISNVMTSNPIVGSPDMDAQDAARMMGQHQIRRLPIVERGTLVGIVALGDISTQPELQHNAGHALQDISKPGSMT
ncbi:MAG: CBS domain-containing protein [Burkholderiales bacterium]